jgi:hypothetical protein
MRKEVPDGDIGFISARQREGCEIVRDRAVQLYFALFHQFQR